MPVNPCRCATASSSANSHLGRIIGEFYLVTVAVDIFSIRVLKIDLVHAPADRSEDLSHGPKRNDLRRGNEPQIGLRQWIVVAGVG